MGPPPKPISFPDSIPKSAQVQDKKELSKSEYDVPALAELRVKEEELEPCLFPGGETEGLKRLEKFICEKNAGWVRNFVHTPFTISDNQLNF